MLEGKFLKDFRAAYTPEVKDIFGMSVSNAGINGKAAYDADENLTVGVINEAPLFYLDRGQYTRQLLEADLSRKFLHGSHGFQARGVCYRNQKREKRIELHGHGFITQTCRVDKLGAFPIPAHFRNNRRKLNEGLSSQILLFPLSDSNKNKRFVILAWGFDANQEEFFAFLGVPHHSENRWLHTTPDITVPSLHVGYGASDFGLKIK